MAAKLFNQVKTALSLLLLLSILTGLIYPLVITAIAQILFPSQANGSLIIKNGKPIGSLLIGQSFTTAEYFWSRPSATMPFAYNAENSSGSNLGPSNPDFLAAVKDRVVTLHKANPQNHDLIPVDLVTASASGLDPAISPLAAFYQAARIAKARGLSEQQVRTLIQSNIKKCWTLLGEPSVNILQLNLALDSLKLNGM